MINHTETADSPSFQSDEAIIMTLKAYKLLEIMLDLGVPLDGFSVSSLMTFPPTSELITSLWRRIEPEISVVLSPAAYRSIINAYGAARDASSACWVFEEMGHVCGNQGRSIECWNVILAALAQGGDKSIDVLNSRAAQRNSDIPSGKEFDCLFSNDHPNNSSTPSNAEGITSLVNKKTCIEASLGILEMMENETLFYQYSKLLRVPKPNSQTYCLVASALARSGTVYTSKFKSKRALELFRNAMDQGLAADGRFLNSVLRCFGDDIDGALAAWKNGIGTAAAAHALNTKRIKNENMNNKQSSSKKANLAASYHGLMHVCGRAFRPDVALRIVYAMNKAGVEPTETSLNCYYAGKRLTMEEKNDSSKLGLRDQYESLLSVECTKYNTNDKRREGDKKIRIIL